MMKTVSRTQLLSALVLSCTILISGSSFAKGFPMQEKLQQCEAAFEKMQSGKMSQADAWNARKQHKQLVREILDNLNKRNTNVSIATGEKLSDEEILNNFKVMGRLLAMLVAEHPAETDEWGYPLE